MYRIVIAIISAAIVLGTSACGPSRPKPPQYNVAHDSDTVSMLDLSSTNQLSRQREWTEVVNGFLKVNMVFRNLRGKTLYLEMRTIFKDENGGEIENTSQTWEPVAVQAHNDYTYSKLCPNQKGQDYHVYVRMAKKQHR